MAGILSMFPINWNQDITQESTYDREFMPEITDIRELPEGIFHINLKLIDPYQWKYPSLMAKYKSNI